MQELKTFWNNLSEDRLKLLWRIVQQEIKPFFQRLAGAEAMGESPDYIRLAGQAIASMVTDKLPANLLVSKEVYILDKDNLDNLIIIGFLAGWEIRGADERGDIFTQLHDKSAPKPGAEPGGTQDEDTSGQTEQPEA